MASELAGKFFQTILPNSTKSQVRFCVSKKNFLAAWQHQVSYMRFVLAKSLGKEGLEKLKSHLLAELNRVEEALQSSHREENIGDNVDVITLMVTFAEQDRSQIGYAYFSNNDTGFIRKEKEVKSQCISKESPKPDTLNIEVSPSLEFPIDDYQAFQDGQF